MRGCLRIFFSICAGYGGPGLHKNATIVIYNIYSYTIIQIASLSYQQVRGVVLEIISYKYRQ